MHACLLIPEILQHIFSDVYLSDMRDCFSLDQLDRRSLAALCRVCHSFKDVALDMLWAELEDLHPLFACLPQDLWSRTGDTLTLRRPVTIAEWSNFEQYASRVRVLGGYDSGIFEDLEAEFVHAIMGLTSKPLLPNLRELYCTEYNSDLHACVRYVLSPDLICFRLRCTLEWTDVMPSVLSGLSKHSPRLKVINLIDMPSDRITELTLRELHHLQDVWLTLVGDKAFQFRSASTLNVLRISSSTLTLIGDMAEQWVVPCKRLKLYSNVSVTALAVERALCELNNRILCDGLEEFQHDLSRIRNPIDHAFSFRTFTPLMRFSSLKVVEFAPFCMSLLDDDALGSIVKSWPRLERLYLGNRFFWEIPPRITFQGLVTVLSSCPNLRELGLVFDATTLDLRTDEKPGDGVCNTNITKLHVGFSPIEQPQKVAIAILAILPCLTDIILDIEPGHEMPRSLDRDVREAKWGEVTKYISFYNLIMKQEGFRV